MFRFSRRLFITVGGALSFTPSFFGRQEGATWRSNHGTAQMQQLFRDRPFIAFFRSSSDELCRVDETSSIFQWAAARFICKEVGGAVVWNSDLPRASGGALGEALSDNVGAYRNAPPYIRISNVYRFGDNKGRYLEFELLWLLLVYELNNLISSVRIAQLRIEAKKGNVLRDEFIKQCAELEFTAMEKTKDFYTKLWVSWAKEQSFVSDSSVWTSGSADTFEEWLKRYDGTPEYPRGFFGKMYDEYSK